MNTKQALALLGISAADFPPALRQQFDDDGYFVIENVFSPTEVDEMRSEFERLRAIEGQYGGHEVHIEPGAPRLSNLFNKSAAFDRCFACKQVLAAAAYLLGEIQIYSLNARNPQKGQGQQLLHSDVPRTSPTDWRVVNSVVMLDDMTKTNGPTRVVPGCTNGSPSMCPMSTWRKSSTSKFVPANWRLSLKTRWPRTRKKSRSQERQDQWQSSTVIWHGGTRNESGEPRRVLHLAMARRDLPQQLNEREHLTPELFNRTNPSQKFLLNIEGATPKVKGYPPIPKEARVWTAAESVDLKH